MPPTLTVENVDDLDFWRELFPEFSIDEAERETPRFPVSDPDQLLECIRSEGYVRVPSVVPEDSVESVRRCIQHLYEAGIPLPFAFVYDELWELFRGAAAYIETLLGGDYLSLPVFWAWYVPPTDDAAGWKPHRDSTKPAIDEDNTPQALTVWLALSDATPLNGCIHALPLRLDDRFKYWAFAGEGSSMVLQPQNIRALPASAGSLMAWNHNLLHWGGRASRFAEGPRCSAAMEFQRADMQPREIPAVDPTFMLTFQERLALIGRMIVHYQDTYPLAPEMAAAAVALWDRFIADVREEVAREGNGEDAG